MIFPVNFEHLLMCCNIVQMHAFTVRCEISVRTKIVPFLIYIGCMQPSKLIFIFCE